MKHLRTNLPFIGLFCLCITLLSSCDKQPIKSDANNTDTKISSTAQDITSLNLIGLTAKPVGQDTFGWWTDRWQRKGVDYMSAAPITNMPTRMTYFDVPPDDLNALLALNSVKTRFYVGLDSVPVTSKIPTGLVPHLLLVGVDGNGVLDLNHVYDYSTICPVNCDI